MEVDDDGDVSASSTVLAFSFNVDEELDDSGGVVSSKVDGMVKLHSAHASSSFRCIISALHVTCVRKSSRSSSCPISSLISSIS